MMTVAATASNRNDPKPYASTLEAVQNPHRQRWNMCGYAAPKLAIVRAGIVGIGKRGIGAVQRLKLIEGLEIKALCDKKMDRAETARKALVDFRLASPKTYGGEEVDWRLID
jgi:hypothetical protein